MRGKIAEVFESLQGEGLYLGKRQIFVRFFGCNLRCNFCDTKLNYFKEYEVLDLLTQIRSYRGSYHSISFTGGEPLMQKDFLKQILMSTSNEGYKNYLEANGTLPKNLKEIIDYIDIVAMDIKLPGSTGLKGYWQEHAEFLSIALNKDVFVKTVICNSTEISDLNKAIGLLVRADRNIPLVLQPNSFEISNELMDRIQEFKKLCLEELPDVRIIPQIHKFIGVR